MLRSWKLGSLFGIKLYIHSTFLILPVLLTVSLALRGMEVIPIAFHLGLLIAVFGCVLLHELGHALMAKRFGVSTRDITLYPIGGVARLEKMPKHAGEELWIALAGPAVNVVIAMLLTPIVLTGFAQGVYQVATLESVLSQGPMMAAMAFVLYLWLANIVLVLFNLLPTFPMDGGRALRAILSMRWSLVRATEVAVFVGRIFIFGGLLALALFVPEILIGNPMLLVVSLFVFLAGQRELQSIRQHAAEDQVLITESSQPQGFSGLLWDSQAKLWTLWRNGQQVGEIHL